MSTCEYSHKNVCGSMRFYAVPIPKSTAVPAVPVVPAVPIPKSFAVLCGSDAIPIPVWNLIEPQCCFCSFCSYSDSSASTRPCLMPSARRHVRQESNSRLPLIWPLNHFCFCFSGSGWWGPSKVGHLRPSDCHLQHRGLSGSRNHSHPGPQVAVL